jgi:hypothetical protein
VFGQKISFLPWRFSICCFASHSVYVLAW